MSFKSIYPIMNHIAVQLRTSTRSVNSLSSSVFTFLIIIKNTIFNKKYKVVQIKEVKKKDNLIKRIIKKIKN